MIFFILYLLCTPLEAIQVPFKDEASRATVIANIKSQLAQLPLLPFTESERQTAARSTPVKNGYIIVTSYANLTTCEGDPYSYFGLKQSYCYKANENYIQYTCKNDNNLNTVNITLTLYTSSDCTGEAVAQGDLALPQDTCDSGAVWSCTTSNSPWTGIEGTLDWYYILNKSFFLIGRRLHTDKKCNKQFGYMLIPDGCLDVGIDVAVQTECMVESGTSYEVYANKECDGNPQGSTIVKFSKCNRELMDDDYYYAADDGYADDDELIADEHRVFSAGCCSDDTDTCTKNAKTRGSNNNACFAASEMVTTAEGHKAISDVTVGDVVLTMTAEGTYKFADVVYVPHAANTISSTFITLTTPTTSLKATPKHLIPAAPCSAESFPLMAMEDVPVGYCVMTVQNGKQPVLESSVSQGSGVYTIVTSESNGHIVVNDVVVSSFGINHAVANTYYNLHRMVYQVAPWLSKSSMMQQFNLMLGDAVLSM